MLTREFDESAEDLYDKAPCGYLSTLQSGEIVRVNHTLCEWLGMERDDLIGTRFQSLLPIGPKIFHDTHFAPLLRVQGFVNEVALEIKRADGHRLPVLVNATEGTVRDGGRVLRRLTVFDATDRRTFERELLAAKKKAVEVAENKARLLAMLSHDVRSPLQSIRLVAQVLKRKPEEPPEPHLSDVLTRATDHVLDLVDSILTLSRLEAGKDRVAKRVFSVRQLVDDLIQVQGQLALGRGLSFVTHVDASVPESLVGDPSKIMQVLNNLVSNAVKFTNEGGVVLHITLDQLTETRAEVRFNVEDTGSGIATDQLDSIFDAYDQGANPDAQELGGSGLGLSICRSIVELLGGDLGVTSTLGSGSTFWFTVPLEVAQTDA